MPVALAGQARRKWLEDHIENPDPSRPEERQRIQVLINKAFSNISLTHLHDEKISEEDIKNNKQSVESDPEIIQSLGKIISQEKADNIQKLRRSIKSMGATNLKKMILHIFNNIGCSEYKDKSVAKQFRLTSPTFSRFAGCQWSENGNTIPDLWKNTAQVLGMHPVFKDVAVKAGVWERVQKTLILTQKG